MEEDPSFGFRRRHVVWNSSNWSMPDMRFKLGNPNMGFPLSNTAYEVISMDGLLPLGGFPGLPHSRLDQCGEHLGWSYGLPRYSQVFSPAIRNIYLKDDLSVDPSGTCIIPGKPDGVDISGSPKLFVFDQSGDQATIIFGPETNRFPIPHIPMATPKQLGIIVSGGGGKTGGTATASKGQYENEDPDVQSEMHEDTEELNALLYSDEEFDYSCDGDEDNDEVTSTGHSPSTMTAHWDHGFGPSKKASEEVNSSLWPQGKKRKLSNECRNPPSSADSYEAENLIGNFDSDDALSSSGDRETISQNREIKRVRISETVGVLESLVPGMKGKNPVEVLDEAIKYLKSLKLKAAVFHGTGSCQKLVEQV